ncbi:PREDICTED: uncharacterized protein LOC109163356 [Ipomoea nil]|uniref:uncharacterized protein LOC109163356 n=1 Tax=Ipomoea nil TaxID=35883 RepID=UPI000901F1C0|nr:PREDICTED: uncharacterized protein LOC109163356 [Ipomoea nil]XP_019167661.1 PREDICTED: uncharacterized protein LOC109163356 [Ipomoea nil]
MPRKKNTTGQVDWDNAKYSVVEGKSLDPAHFSSEVLSMLKYQGLLNLFLLIKNDTYPELVKEFYRNMKIRRENEVTIINSKVKNVKIVLDPPCLARMLRLTLIGVSKYGRESWIETESVGYQDYLQYMLGQREGIARDVRPVKSELTAEQRILVMLVSESLLPNRNKSNIIGSMECTFAYFLKHRVKFNLPVLMVNHMEFCKNSNRKSLPYGMILSWIFEQKGVNVTNVLAKPPGRLTFNAPNLRYCEIYQIENKEYITTDELSRMPADERRALMELYHIPNKKSKSQVQGEEEEEQGSKDEVKEEDEDRPSNEDGSSREHRQKGGHDPRSTVDLVLFQIFKLRQVTEQGFRSVNAKIDEVCQMKEAKYGNDGPAGLPGSSSGARIDVPGSSSQGGAPGQGRELYDNEPVIENNGVHLFDPKLSQGKHHDDRATLTAASAPAAQVRAATAPPSPTGSGSSQLPASSSRIPAEPPALVSHRQLAESIQSSLTMIRNSIASQQDAAAGLEKNLLFHLREIARLEKLHAEILAAREDPASDSDAVESDPDEDDSGPEEDSDPEEDPPDSGSPSVH